MLKFKWINTNLTYVKSSSTTNLKIISESTRLECIIYLIRVLNRIQTQVICTSAPGILIDVKTRHSPGETYLQIESNTKKSYKIAESFINPLLQLKVIIRPFPYH